MKYTFIEYVYVHYIHIIRIMTCYGAPLSFDKFQELCKNYFWDDEFVGEQCNAIAKHLNTEFNWGTYGGPYKISSECKTPKNTYSFEDIEIIVKLNKGLKKYGTQCEINSKCCRIDEKKPILILTRGGDVKDDYDSDDSYKKYCYQDGSYVRILEKEESVKEKINEFFDKYLPRVKPFHFYLSGYTWCSCT